MPCFSNPYSGKSGKGWLVAGLKTGIVVALLALAPVTGWTQQGSAPAGAPDLAAAFARIGATERGFDPQAFLDGPVGQWALATRGFSSSHKEDDPAVIAHWAEIGMDKQLFDTESVATKWSLFTPANMKTGPDAPKLPLIVVHHGGGSSIFEAETEGYVEAAAKRNFILAFVPWNANGASEAMMAEAEKSGLHYESYQFQRVLNRLKDIAPVDMSRVYVVGFSGGGNATGYVGADLPELVAGIAPSTGVIVQTLTEQDLAKVAKVRIGLFLGYGTMDAEGRWPISETVHELGPVPHPETPMQRLDNTNAWLRAAGAVNALTTPDIVAQLAVSGRNDAAEKFGLNFDRNVRQSLETTYYFGDYLNDDGMPVVRFMAVGGNPHYMSPSWAEQSVDFLSRFSRDPDTRMLVIGRE